MATELKIRIITNQNGEFAEQELRNAIHSIGYNIEEVLIDHLKDEDVIENADGDKEWL